MVKIKLIFRKISNFLLSSALIWGVFLYTSVALSAAAGPAQAEGGGYALIILSEGQDLSAMLEAFESYGVEVRHVFPPDAFIVFSTSSIDLASFIAGGEAAGAAAFYEPVDRLASANWGVSAQQAARLWNNLQVNAATRGADAVVEIRADDPPDAFKAPESETLKMIANTTEAVPNLGETSQFFIGSVAVGLVLPESNGAVDTSSEDWTEEERAQVVSEIVNAMDWWAGMEPAAHLSFVYDNSAANTVPTGVEPISRSYVDQKYWIEDTMTEMGFDGSNYFDQVRVYNNYLRQTYQTDWAFTIFVVDSSADSDNRFSDGHFAYAYLGGPFMTLSYGNNGYGASNMDAVAAHEVGHIFRALDQYASANQSCALTAGYLGVENQNSQLGCVKNEPSIMRGQVWPYTKRQIDTYAKGQLGWRDSDENGILDPVDVGLKVSDLSWIQGEASNVLIFSATMAEIPLSSPKYRNILINKLQSAQYRVDEGPWLPVEAVDGRFDSYQEDFTFTTDHLSSATHNFYLQTVDDYGKVNEELIATLDVVDPAEGQLDTELNSISLQDATFTRKDTPIFSGRAKQFNGGYILSVEFRIDGGDWLLAQAIDGVFDSEAEEFEFMINMDTLSLDVHIIEARAIDNLGYVDSTPASVAVTLEAEQSANTIFLPMVMR